MARYVIRVRTKGKEFFWGKSSIFGTYSGWPAGASNVIIYSSKEAACIAYIDVAELRKNFDISIVSHSTYYRACKKAKLLRKEEANE